ncbi:MAG: cell division protein ZapA [Muribaculaceae bacterium]|nr:cell division protein ZapA [Muribaculaceae bacterium]
MKRLSTVMADNNKVKIWIQLADAENPIALSISPEDEENYRKAEELVNTLWKKWMERFNGTSNDVLGRVAFQFARLYLEAYGENRQVNDFLTNMDQTLETLVEDLE